MKNSGTRRSTTTKGRQTKRRTTRARSTAKQKGLYREIWGILLVLSGLLALLGYSSWIGVVGEFFAYIPSQLFGILYGIPTLLVMYVGLGLLLKDPKKKEPILRPSVSWIWYILLFVSVLSLISFIMQDVTTPVSMLDESYRLSHGGLIGGGIAELLYSVGKRLGGLLINIVAFLIFLSLALRISLGTGIRKVGEKTKGPAKQLGTVVVDKSVQAAHATTDYLSNITIPKPDGKIFDRAKDYNNDVAKQEDSVGQWMSQSARNTEAAAVAFDPALAQDVAAESPVTPAAPVASATPVAPVPPVAPVTPASPVAPVAGNVQTPAPAVSPSTVQTPVSTGESRPQAPKTIGATIMASVAAGQAGFGATEGREGLNFTSYVGQRQAEADSATQADSSYDESLDDYNYSEEPSYRAGYTSFSPDTVTGHGYAAGYGAAHTEEYVEDDRALAAEETSFGDSTSTESAAIDSIDSMEQSWSNAMAEDYGNLRDVEDGSAVAPMSNTVETSSTVVPTANIADTSSTDSQEGRGVAAAAFGAAVTAATAPLASAATAPLASAATATLASATAATPAMGLGAATATATQAATAAPATGFAPLSQGEAILNTVSTDEDTQAVAVNTEGSAVPSGRKGLGLRYEFPSLEILSKGPDSIVNESEVLEKSTLLEQTLSSFKINSKVISATRGPAVTRYEMDLPPGVKVSRILNLADNIKLALAAADIRMEAPIPGKSLVGIEVPNSKVSPVHLRDVLDCSDFKNAKGGVPVGLGKDISGKPIITDLTKMPHLLVAGSTGSGKSVCINTLISSILFSRKPDEVKLILIDPKKVELSTYDKVPHLMVPVVTDMKKAASVLRWAVREMESRYRSFADTGCKNIEGYNKQFPDQTFPYIVLIIDELADLMMTAPDDIEDSICRLAQMARAAGIHMVLATQRPSVNVITGTIKANVPSRISFAVATQIDSRTILDMGGAEKLLGKGDMLFNPIGANKPVRIQGAFISDDEVEALVDFVKEQAAQKFDESAQEALKDEPEPSEEEAKSIRQDEFLEKAVNVAFDYGASTSMLQRRIHVGYSRAGSLIDAMEELKILGPANGSKPRELLMTKEEALALVNRQGN